MSYFNFLKILAFQNVYTFKLTLLMHKIKKNPRNIPAIIFGLASEVHSYSNRFATNFNIYRLSIGNNYGATVFSFVTSKIWESVPLELKKLSYNRFYKLDYTTGERIACPATVCGCNPQTHKDHLKLSPFTSPTKSPNDKYDGSSDLGLCSPPSFRWFHYHLCLFTCKLKSGCLF